MKIAERRAALAKGGVYLYYFRWETPLDGVSGQMVISTLTADRLVATFEFIAAPGKKNLLGGTRTITDGQIDLPFSGALTPVPENIGSKVSATLNGSPSCSITWARPSA